MGILLYIVLLLGVVGDSSLHCRSEGHYAPSLHCRTARGRGQCDVGILQQDASLHVARGMEHIIALKGARAGGDPSAHCPAAGGSAQWGSLSIVPHYTGYWEMGILLHSLIAGGGGGVGSGAPLVHRCTEGH